MPIDEGLVKAAEPFARVMLPREHFDLQRRVDRAIDDTGRLIQTGEPFIRLQSPDGSVWRVKVDNSGALSATRE